MWLGLQKEGRACIDRMVEEKKKSGRDGRIGHAQGKREALFDCMWEGGCGGEVGMRGWEGGG